MKKLHSKSKDGARKCTQYVTSLVKNSCPCAVFVGEAELKKQVRIWLRNSWYTVLLSHQGLAANTENAENMCWFLQSLNYSIARNFTISMWWMIWWYIFGGLRILTFFKFLPWHSLPLVWQDLVAIATASICWQQRSLKVRKHHMGHLQGHINQFK